MNAQTIRNLAVIALGGSFVTFAALNPLEGTHTFARVTTGLGGLLLFAAGASDVARTDPEPSKPDLLTWLLVIGAVLTVVGVVTVSLL